MGEVKDRGDAPSLTGLAAWRTIETAPKDGTAIIAWWPHLDRPVVAWISRGGSNHGKWNVSHSRTNKSSMQGKPTHWIPIPAGPDAAPDQPEQSKPKATLRELVAGMSEDRHGELLTGADTATPSTEEPSAAAHETAREHYSANTEQVIAELCEALEDAKGTFEHIADYWNRDDNENAMKDACWMAINEAGDAAKIIDEALSKARGAAG